MKNSRTKATDISKAVKLRVNERDNGYCILCGKSASWHESCCHVIPRSSGGLGIEENIVTLCQECHKAFDEGPNRQKIMSKLMGYMHRKYKHYTVRKVVYGGEKDE